MQTLFNLYIFSSVILNNIKMSVKNTYFSTFIPMIALLPDEINLDLTILCETHF